MKTEKIALIKKGIDIGRIIPFNILSKESDFKISFSKNEYSVYVYPFLSEIPQKIKMENMNGWEISYHRSTVFKPTVIHLKEKKNQATYSVLPLEKLVDPTAKNEFPIPFMRIQVPNNFQSTEFKQKKSGNPIIFDMEDANVAEFYLTNNNFDYEEFSIKWPSISSRLLISPFEYFATNSIRTNGNKYKYFIPQGEEARTAAIELDINEDMKFFINVYNDPEFEGEDIKVTFIENKFAVPLMVLSPRGYKNSQGKIEMKYAFEEDLRNGSMSTDDKNKWRYRFKRMERDLVREMRRIRRNK